MPQSQDNVRFILLVMMIFWLNTSNDVATGVVSAPMLILARLNRQRMSYYTLRDSHWGDFQPRQYLGKDPERPGEGVWSSESKYLNITGFREEDGLAWDDLNVFRERCLQLSRNAYPSPNGVSLWDQGLTMLTWQNATSSVHGPWVRESASVERYASSYNLTTIAALSFDKAREGYGSGSNTTSSTSDVQRQSIESRSADTPENPDKLDHTSSQDGHHGEHQDENHEEHTRHPRSFPMPSMDWGRNITGSSGKLIVRVTDQVDEETYAESRSTAGGLPTGGLVRAAMATVTIEDIEGTGSSYDMRLHGVHWPRQGAMLLTTTSDKFSGIFGLPHMAPDPGYFSSSQRLLDRTLDKALKERESPRPFGPPELAFSTPLWSSTIDGTPEGLTPLPRCEYIMYLQIHPLDASQFLPHAAKAKKIPSAAMKDTVNTARGFDAGLENIIANSTTLKSRDLPQDYDYTQDEMTQIMLSIENELRFPTGAPIFHKGVPEIQMSAVLYSPDCAYFIQTKGPPDFAPADGQHLRGRKVEEFIFEARMWMLALAGVLFCQIRLFLGQVCETYTPSTLGRISFLTMATMVLADGLVFSAASAWSITASASFLPSLMVTFAGFTSMIMGGYFLSEVYAAQEPERRRRDREQLQQMQQHQTELRDRLRQHYANTRVGTAPIIVPSDQDIDAEIAENAMAAATPLLPTPVTAPGPMGSGNNGAAGAAGATNNAVVSTSLPFSTITARMLMLGVILMFLSLAATTWWASLRAYYTNTLSFIYLSMWVPQIVRNIERNSRRALSWRFMIGQSVLRLLPLSYFYLRSDNILFGETDWRSFAVLTGWVWTQMWVLAAQDVLGPRYGIPSSWVPEAWEYHPVLHEDNVEAGGLPIGLVSTVAPPESNTHGAIVPPTPAGAPKRRLSSSGMASYHSQGPNATGVGALANTNIWTLDCAICCEALDVPVVRAGVDDPTSGGVAGVLARRQYMVTPCRHIFHTQCLEGWLRFRLQCPICRDELPPL